MDPDQNSAKCGAGGGGGVRIGGSWDQSTLSLMIYQFQIWNLHKCPPTPRKQPKVARGGLNHARQKLPQIFSRIIGARTRQAEPLNLVHKYARTQVRRNSFSTRVAEPRNKLWRETRESRNVQQFKKNAEERVEIVRGGEKIWLHEVQSTALKDLNNNWDELHEEKGVLFHQQHLQNAPRVRDGEPLQVQVCIYFYIGCYKLYILLTWARGWGGRGGGRVSPRAAGTRQTPCAGTRSPPAPPGTQVSRPEAFICVSNLPVSQIRDI